jgi:ABC-2 type transport system permease protein
MLQLARFPVQIYPQRVQTFFFTALPVAWLTTIPTQALLGRTGPTALAVAVPLGFAALFGLSRFFHYALRFYGSASS